MKKFYGVLFMILAAGCVSQNQNIQEEFHGEPDKWIAFTFDDGPSGNTSWLLDVLKANNIKATFFVTAKNLEFATNKAIVQRMSDEGHEFANHTWSHEPLGDGRSKEAIREVLEKSQAAIKKATGSEAVLFRAPNYSRNSSSTEVLKEMGLPYIGGSSAPDDWDGNVTTALITKRVIDSAKDGGIIVMHDFGNANTIPAIPRIAKELRRQGYGFITVSELAKLKDKTLVPGTWYDNF
ncbi:MAG: polysaccharide deacetylase family protein [Treponema sp.]|nr:polysaccharide deacetylase family protein [Treponema sp.]